MFAICIESSHLRGMGHFYRGLNLINQLIAQKQPYILYINDHQPSKKILNDRGLNYKVVNLQDSNSQWESLLISKDNISIWINDRLNTDIIHAKKIKSKNIPLVTFDDRGEGAVLSDINIAALSFDPAEQLYGSKTLRGIDYLILDPLIESYARLRTKISSVLVTLGGSDTYGVTVNVVEQLKAMNLDATIVVGPAFMHLDILNNVLTERFILKQNVSSMIKEFHYHDLAITGGGITPFEANASGLPCVIIANEVFEVPIGSALQKLGTSIFAGHHKSFLLPSFIDHLSLEKMSKTGMQKISTNGVQRVVKVLMELIK